MRIAAKITLALGAASLAVFGLNEVRLVREERSELLAALEASTLLLARSVQLSVEHALRDGQPGDVAAVLASVHAEDPATACLVRSAAGETIAATELPAALPLAALAEEAAATRRRLLRYLPEAQPTHLVVALPTAVEAASAESAAAGAEPSGSLVVSHPLAELQALLRRTTLEVALSVALFALAAAVIGHLLGRFYIGVPLEALARAMRKVRLGDLRSGVQVGQKDEIAAVGEEFNAMVDDLRETRERLRAESDSKRRLETGLQEANRLITIGQLAASLAHEIGSPLQVLGGRARRLVGRAEEPERVRQDGRIIAEQADRIAGIVEQLLRLVRELPAPHERIDLAAAVGAVVELVRHEAEREGCPLSLEVERDLPRVEADAGQVQQVVLNLLTNALHATSAGQAIRVTVARATLERSFGAAVPACSLVVEDEGRGIEPHLLERVFEPFFTLRAAEGGTGLGLAVVRSLVERHQGRLSLRSRTGEGTRVEVLLPLAQAPAPPAPVAGAGSEELEP